LETCGLDNSGVSGNSPVFLLRSDGSTRSIGVAAAQENAANGIGTAATGLASTERLVNTVGVPTRPTAVSMNRGISAAALIFLALLAPLTAQAQNYATSTFHKLQALAGDWEGKDDAGNVVKTKFQVVAGNTAVMETLTMPGMEEMLTLYSVDGDGIMLVHFCPTNNQPRMRAVPSSASDKTLVFAFQGAANLPDISVGHEQRMVLQFNSPDQIVERWTWRKNGKDTEMIYHLARIPAGIEADGARDGQKKPTVKFISSWGKRLVVRSAAGGVPRSRN
jgi:hypothetical protein